MPKALVTLAYKQIIDIHSKGLFEEMVFRDSYQEFLIQIQSFDQDKKYKTWEELRVSVPKANVNVQYKTGFAIGRYIQMLNNKIPGLEDNLGRTSVSFSVHEFEIISSDIRDHSVHKVAITYFTDTMTLAGNIGDYIILADDNQSKDVSDTFTLKMRSSLSITRYQDIA
jgi:hypothetical protein